MATHPTARQDALFIQALDREMMVFDAVRETYHLLNPVAAAVFRQADGATPLPEIRARVGAELGVAVDDAEVGAAVGELAAAGLMVPGAQQDASAMSRRDAARRLGALALAPFVTSLLAPLPAMAASGGVAPKIKGNNGVGNGEDPPPPGIGNSGNDGPGRTPGNPGGSETSPGNGGGDGGGNGGGNDKPKGNNGVGNGVDPAPPGVGNAGNDAPGQTPGNPGGNTTAPGQTGGNPTGNSGSSDNKGKNKG
jgi:hypothetical protein